MTNIAILVGNSKYDNLSELNCCDEDVKAVEQLLSVTGKYSEIISIINKTSNELKDEIRSIIKRHEDIDELFFYFTGHGDLHDEEFFYCATNYKTSESNVTGLSEGDLDGMLRPANTTAVIKIIDACHSGIRLIKSGNHYFSSNTKSPFNNYFRIASCHEDQSSFTGKSLSVFTASFIEAVLHKNEGKIYYSDIIARLRDISTNSIDQIPYFVTQGNNQTYFCENATMLTALRDQYTEKVLDTETVVGSPDEASNILSRFDKLQEIESKYSDKEMAQSFITDFISSICTAVEADDSYKKYYELETIKHNDFDEAMPKVFMVRVLSKQNRPDKLVEARVTRKQKKRNRFGTALMLSSVAMGGYEEDYIDEFDLYLNCSLESVQLKLTFVPKFKCLKQLSLIVSFAPSLPVCYVFEYWSQHSLNEWDTHEDFGEKFKRVWYKFDWNESSDGVVKKIINQLNELVETSLDAVLNEEA